MSRKNSPCTGNRVPVVNAGKQDTNANDVLKYRASLSECRCNEFKGPPSLCGCIADPDRVKANGEVVEG
jgi:hypothetical protein